MKKTIFWYLALIGLIWIQIFFLQESVLAESLESFEKFIEEFDILRTQILDSNGYINNGLVNTLEALTWYNRFLKTFRVVQWKRLNGIGRYTSDEVDERIELSIFLLEWINPIGVDDYQKVVRLVLAYKSPKVQNLTQLMEIDARK